jgi:translation initiation factor IF-3
MGKPNKNKKEEIKEPRINDEIRGNYDVRVIFTNEDGETENKVMPLWKAKNLAGHLELDLIEINPNATPPVCKISDYSKYLYELKKQAKAKKQNRTEVKEISLSVGISMHDLEIKAKKAKEFIEKGDKVKVSLLMKRRELERRELSKKSILEFIVLMNDVATPESLPKDEGNKCIVILKKK